LGACSTCWAQLPLHIEHVSIERLERPSAAGGVRRTTLARLRGNGREGAQIQLLAALFHPDGPNDVAPGAYNAAEPPPALPWSPLDVSSRPGFG